MAGSVVYDTDADADADDGAGEATFGRTPGDGLGEYRGRGEPGDLEGMEEDGAVVSSCMMLLMVSFTTGVDRWTEDEVEEERREEQELPFLSDLKGEGKRREGEEGTAGDWELEGWGRLALRRARRGEAMGEEEVEEEEEKVDTYVVVVGPGAVVGEG